MQWDETYAIGHSAVDNDHKRLFEVYDQFIGALDRGETKESVDRFLEDLVEYSHAHFQREEGIMRGRNYPDYDKHKRMHDTFCDYVRKLAASHEHDAEEVTFLRNYVEMWLCGHILVMDKWLGEWLDAQEAASPST